MIGHQKTIVMMMYKHRMATVGYYVGVYEKKI